MTNAGGSPNNQRLYLTITLFAVLSVIGCTQSAQLGSDIKSGMAEVRTAEAATEAAESSLLQSHPHLAQLISTADELRAHKAGHKRKAPTARSHTSYQISRFNVLSSADPKYLLLKAPIQPDGISTRAPPQLTVLF